MFLSLLLYFFLAIIIDVLLTRYYLALSRQQESWGAFLSMVITWFNMTVINELVHSNKQPFIIAFALGAYAGTRIGLRLSKPKAKVNVIPQVPVD